MTEGTTLSSILREAMCEAVRGVDPNNQGHIEVHKSPEVMEKVIGKKLRKVDRDIMLACVEMRAHRGLVNTSSLVSIMADTLQHTTDWGDLKLKTYGYVGIDSLQDQLRRKVLRRGLEFNLMVVGQSGLGKSTLVNTLFKSNVSRRTNSQDKEKFQMSSTTQVKSISHLLEEKGVRVRLTITDTPGFGDYVNNENCWLPIVDFISHQYDKYLTEEENVNRKRFIPDTRIHCCLYFIPPTGHSLRPLDVEVLKRLDKVVNVVPVIAKADTLTVEERALFKNNIKCDLERHKVRIYPQPEYEDPDDGEINAGIRRKTPYAVVGSSSSHDVNGRSVLGRKTGWGVIEVENKNHCEFADLRDMLIKTHMQDLIDVTANLHYENFRLKSLQGRKHLDIDIGALNESSL